MLGRKPSDMMKDAAGVLKNTAEAVEGRIVGYGGSKYPAFDQRLYHLQKANWCSHGYTGFGPP